ncbi:MAG TPA: DNA polymerase IV [Acidimicrobiales bacterium]|nr:DNA polymerase IV [Acidimicrobiales bacterium]
MSDPQDDQPCILHVDMDSFYVSVEMQRDPTLVGRPVVVGGTGDRGVVASCSYEARVYGIHSAMPTTRARRLCPHAVFLPGRFDDYTEASRRIHEVFRSYTPLVEGVALDEAFLDVAGARRLFGSPVDIAHGIRRRIGAELGLNCSVGVGRTKLVAKLASRAAKPRVGPGGVSPGEAVVVVEDDIAFLHPLPVRALWGVGPATAARLERMGVSTVGDLARLPRDWLVSALGQALGRQLHDLAWGRDPRRVVADRPTKSIGHEETYARDHHDHEVLDREVVRMSDAVAARLRAAGLRGRTVTLKVRFGDFTTITRSHTAPTAIDTAPDIAHAAGRLLEGVDVEPGVRLLGVSVSALTPSSGEQLSLDQLTGGDWEAASRAVDEVRRRFGDRSVGPAALAGAGTLDLKRQGDTQWGPSAPGQGPRTG